MADIYRVFNSWGTLYYPYLLHICHPSLLVEDELMGLIKRKNYCEKFNVAPYPGTYDDQPEWWLIASTIIDNATQGALNWKNQNG